MLGEFLVAGRGADLEHGCFPQGAGKELGDVGEVCKEIASLGDGHPVIVTLPGEGRRPRWGCSLLAGRKCQAGSDRGGARDSCLAPHLKDADKPGSCLPRASVSLSRHPLRKDWVNATGSGHRTQQYGMVLETRGI